MKGRMGRQQAKYYARSHRKNLRVSLDTNKKSSFALLLDIFFFEKIVKIMKDVHVLLLFLIAWFISSRGVPGFLAVKAVGCRVVLG